MRRPSNASPESRRLRLAKCLLALVWLAIIAICLLHKDEFTLEGILNYTPRQPALAVLLLWALFAVKSLSIFLYSGLLYAAGGILFPLPVAIAVNVAGTAVMVSLPYWLGKKLGSQAVQYILRRWPKSAMLHDLRGGSDFFFVLIVRLLGVLSADVVSAYMGAVGVKYRDYLPACLLGFFAHLRAVSRHGHEPLQRALSPVSHSGGHRACGYAALLHHLSFLQKKSTHEIR